MKIKSVVAATILAASALGAQATPLGNLAGSYTWQLLGLTAENTLDEDGNATNFGNSGGWETTWGVGRITTIQKGANPANWFIPGVSGPEYLNFAIYGIADIGFAANGSNFDIFNAGATSNAGADGKIHLDVYTSSAAVDLDNVHASTVRTGYDTFNLGTLYLKTTLEPEYFNGDPNTTLWQLVSALSGQVQANGKGEFYANVTNNLSTAGLAGTSKWDSNGVDNNATPSFDGFDFGGSYHVQGVTSAINTGFLGQEGPYNSTGWTNFINDPIASRALPEPGSLALVGLSLVGLGGLRRKLKA